MAKLVVLLPTDYVLDRATVTLHAPDAHMHFETQILAGTMGTPTLLALDATTSTTRSQQQLHDWVIADVECTTQVGSYVHVVTWLAAVLGWFATAVVFSQCIRQVHRTCSIVCLYAYAIARGFASGGMTFAHFVYGCTHFPLDT